MRGLWTRRSFLVFMGSVLVGCDVANREPSHTVTIQRGSYFEPSSLTVRQGTMIAWYHRGDTVHTVTADPAKSQAPQRVMLPEGASPFDSGDLYPGERWVHTFDTPGTYFYFCRYHELEEMYGVVVVTAHDPSG